MLPAKKNKFASAVLPLNLYRLLLFALSMGLVLSACRRSKSTPEKPSVETKAMTDSSAANTSPRFADTRSAARRQEVVVIQGMFDPAGTKLIELKPVRRAFQVYGPASAPARGIFMVRIAFVNGVLINVPFDAFVADDSPGGATVHGFFEVTIPVGGEVAAIRLTDAADRITFARIAGAEIQR